MNYESEYYSAPKSHYIHNVYIIWESGVVFGQASVYSSTGVLTALLK